MENTDPEIPASVSEPEKKKALSSKCLLPECKRPLPKRKPVVSKETLQADWKNKEQKKADATETIFARRLTGVDTKKPEFKISGKEQPPPDEEQRKSGPPLSNRRTSLPDRHSGDRHSGGDLVKQHSSTKIKHSALDPQFGAIFTESSQKYKIKELCCYFRPNPPALTPTELNDKIHKLHKLCLIHLEDSYRVHVNRLKGIEVLDEIIERTNIQELTTIQVMSLVWCVLSCVHHFYIRLTVRHGVLSWVRRRQARKAMRIYERLIMAALPKLFKIVMRAVMTFYSESRMWNTEYLCAELLKRLLYISQQSENAVHAILDIAEKTSLSNMHEARQVIRVLYQVLENYPWTDIDEYLIMRLLMMFQRSIIPCNDNVDYVPLQRGLEICLRHVIANLPSISLLQIIKTMLQWTFNDEITDEALLNFSNVLEYAAMMHQTHLFRDSLYQELFPLILQLVASENRLHSLLGNHVLQHLIDRHDNRGFFDTPKLFFDDIHFDIMVSQYNSEDKAFIRKYREILHEALLVSIQLHGIHRINLESTYTSIALFLVEIPCGYTAAAIVCLAMAIQEYALSDETLELECSHHLHATVMAIMSLVCWVHSAQVFYDYLKLVVARRAQFAPHLNPPLMATYQYAQHHVLWNKPELFFEDWEARYGLWKCFRTRRTRVGSVTEKTKSETEIL